MFPTQDGRIVVFAGYCKEKVKKKEVGVTLIDMFLLSPDKHDETGVKWRWQTVKQVRRQSKRILYASLRSSKVSSKHSLSNLH